MTYADTITLLFCLVVIFASVANGRTEKPKPQTRPAVEQPMLPPIVFADGRPFHDVADPYATADTDTDIDDAPAKPIASQRAQSRQTPAAAVHPDFVPVTNDRREPAWATGPKRASLSYPVIAEHLNRPGAEPRGDRITTFEISSTAFFDSGSAILRDGGKPILQDVAGDLNSERLKDYQVTIEGHTDDVPIRTAQFASNWELSTARAAAVVHFLLDQGVAARRLRAAGYADTFPVAPNRDAAGNTVPENQARNRRVVIRLEKIERAERSFLLGASDSTPP